VLIATDHDAVDWNLIGQKASLVVDTRNAMTRASNVNATVVKA
jgi:UDP-N-acetyl-D-glucosamine dehydrogenase